MQKCTTCDFWVQEELAARGVGQCHAMPPQLLLKTMPVDATGKVITSKLNALPAVGAIEIPQQYWPATGKDEGCGCHHPKISH